MQLTTRTSQLQLATKTCNSNSQLRNSQYANPQLATHNSQLATRNSQLASRNLQLQRPTRNSQL